MRAAVSTDIVVVELTVVVVVVVVIGGGGGAAVAAIAVLGLFKLGFLRMRFAR